MLKWNENETQNMKNDKKKWKCKMKIRNEN